MDNFYLSASPSCHQSSTVCSTQQASTNYPPSTNTSAHSSASTSSATTNKTKNEGFNYAASFENLSMNNSSRGTLLPKSRTQCNTKPVYTVALLSTTTASMSACIIQERLHRSTYISTAKGSDKKKKRKYGRRQQAEKSPLEYLQATTTFLSSDGSKLPSVQIDWEPSLPSPCSDIFSELDEQLKEDYNFDDNGSSSADSIEVAKKRWSNKKKR